ncbi:MAG: hypothetical protein ABJ004_07520 [Cyclobacteriaceae bacterium]
MITAFILAFLSIKQPSEKYTILFSRIDNQAKVYIQDSLIFASKIYDGNPELNLRLDLSPYLKKGSNQVRVELINGSGAGLMEKDDHWEIYYEIFENADPIDFLTQQSNNGKIGPVFTMTHEIEVY